MDADALALTVLLGRTPLFRSLSDADFQALTQLLRRRIVAEGKVLFEQGAPGDSMVIVGKGRLQVLVTQEDGTETPVGQLKPGDVIGEMSLVDPAPRSAKVVAETAAQVFELDQPTLQLLREHAPSAVVVVVGGIIEQLTARLRETNQKIEQAVPRPGRDKPSVSGIMPRMTAAPAQDPDHKPRPYKGTLDLEPLRAARGLTARDLEVLVSVAPPMLYPDGAVLCHEGAPGSSCFILAQGYLEVVRRIADTQRVLATLSPGALAGQLALIDRTGRSATVRALGDAVVLSLGRDDFEKLLKARSPLAIRFQEQVAIAGARQLRMATERLHQVLQSTGGTTRVMSPAARQSTEAALGDIRTSLMEWSLSLDEMAAQPEGAPGQPEHKRKM